MNRPKIIAVDFDDTLATNAYPSIGEPIQKNIDYIKREQKRGSRLILWTCRRDEQLAEAVEWCKQYGIEFEAVNENLPDMIEFFGGDTRKIFSNVYYDDKAFNPHCRTCMVALESEYEKCVLCGGECHHTKLACDGCEAAFAAGVKPSDIKLRHQRIIESEVEKEVKRKMRIVRWLAFGFGVLLGIAVIVARSV